MQTRKPGDFIRKVRRIIRLRQLSYSTEKNYVHWIKRFIKFHGLRHPNDLGPREVSDYLTYLAAERAVSAATQNQALNALAFLYKHVVHKELGKLPQITRSRRPRNIPVVLTREEISRTLDQLTGQHRLIASLLYGSGLRLGECLTLRVKDIELDQR